MMRASRWRAGVVLAWALALGCGRADAPTSGASAGDATDPADRALAAARGDVVTACRLLAERGDWQHALELCRAAHEARPDDLSLEHAFQQSRAAAGE